MLELSCSSSALTRKGPPKKRDFAVKVSKGRAGRQKQEELLAANETSTDALDLATELTVAWLANPNTRAGAEDVPAFLSRMHAALGNLAAPQAAEEPETEQQFTPAVSVRKSLASPDHIISMIDGKPYKTLRRHLSRHGLTPEQYRERFGLKPDYPMTSEAYSQVRRDLAKRIGLGRKAAAPAEPSDAGQGMAQPSGRGRRRKAEAKAA
jgi:predicted transcriptional regulator